MFFVSIKKDNEHSVENIKRVLFTIRLQNKELASG